MIRTATEEDLVRILEIEREAISPPWSHGSLLREIYSDDSFFAVWDAGTVPVSHVSRQENRPPVFQDKRTVPLSSKINGFIILRRVADEAELFQIAIDPAFRRRGIADALMEAALNSADSYGVISIYLEVRNSNIAAISLYKKHGFEQAHLREEYYTEPVEDAVVMARFRRAANSEF